jgi:glyoxylate reductase/D-3-phosphoglycerate dehydrogenase
VEANIAMERVLVVGPKDTLSRVDDLAPKGFEIVKALHNSPEMKAALRAPTTSSASCSST